MTTPEPGWYADPAGSGQERWWGGVEWTHDVRSPAPAPALADVPGGGLNPFAEIDAQLATEAAAAAIAVDPGAVSPSWYDPNRQAVLGPPPTNGLATAGFVLSLIPGLWLFGLILSIIGITRANQLANEGEYPVGRRLASWGLGLSIAAPLVLGILTSIAVPVFLEQRAQLAGEQLAEVAEDEGVSRSEVVTESDGSPARYVRAEIEKAYLDAFAEAGTAVDAVTCPDEASMVVGGGFTCSFVFEGATHLIEVTWTSASGDFTTTLDGVVQE